MPSPSKQKKAVKAPASRPVGTSAISHPVVEDATTSSSLSAFSPDGELFAFLSLALDKHRLRIYDTQTGRSVAEYVAENVRVTALSWARTDLSSGKQPATEASEESAQPSKKRRKNAKRNSEPAMDVDNAGESNVPAVQVVVLGLSDGTLLLFSPSHGRVVRTLSSPASSSEILSVLPSENPSSPSTVWTSSADGHLSLWDAQKNDLLGSWKTDAHAPYSSITLVPTRASVSDDDHIELLVANHSIQLLSVDPSTTSGKLTELASLTGHASKIVYLKCLDSTSHQRVRLISTAETDRHVHVWELPGSDADSRSSTKRDGKLAALVPLDADVRYVSVKESTLLALSASGRVSLFSLAAVDAPTTKKNKPKVQTLEPRSTIVISAKKNSGNVKVVNACFVAGETGQVRIARLAGGVKPVFDSVNYLDDSGEYIQDVSVVSDASLGLGEERGSVGGAPNKRYAEPSSLALRSGAELGQDASMDDLGLKDVEGDLDVNLAELSLGQRLTASNGGVDVEGSSASEGQSDREPDGEASGALKPRNAKSKRSNAGEVTLAPANSLTRTLIQALHSSDTRLLETCLNHSNQTLIRNTVKRLPPQLAVPLLNACVERLGRGPRANTMKGGGGGASSQRGTGLVNWIKAVMMVHSGHLMTMPDLVARLSGLHATLTTRLALQESLLSLNGRLDMVLSQIEMRSSAAPAPVGVAKKGAANAGGKREPTWYVEGESEDEEEVDSGVEVESGDDAGSIEDVELGGESEDEDESEEEDDEEEDQDEEDSEGERPILNGFVDDEAEEYSEDEDEGDSE